MRLTTLILLVATTAAHAGDKPHVHHVPPAEAEPGAPFVLRATIARAWESAALELHFRAIGTPTWRSEPFQRGAEEGVFEATIPPDFVHPPGFEYFVAAREKDGSTRAHFASAGDPHRVAVLEKPGEVLRNQELAKVHGRKARFRAGLEYVDFGTRELDNPLDPLDNTTLTEVRDYYTRIDIDFTYRLMKFPLYQIRFGFTRLLGATPYTARAGGRCTVGRPENSDDTDCEGQAGIKGGGWFELRLRATRLIDADLRLIVAGLRETVGFGARGEVRVGPEAGSHLALGAEAIQETGYTAFVRLAWDTVPRLPMAASIELSNYPAWHRDSAVRLVYDVGFPLDGGLRFGVRAGYQARDQGIGGVSLGANASLDF